MPACIGYTKR